MHVEVYYNKRIFNMSNRNATSLMLKKIAFFLTSIFILHACTSTNASPIQRSYEVSPNDTITEDSTIFFTISSVGDIMAHQTQLNAQKQADGSYDFKDNYQYMKPLFESFDLMIANVETTFAGAKKGYSAYPRFNTPDALAEAIKYSGIDVVSTTNNHLFDNGTNAMFRTLDVLRAQGLTTLGTHKDTTEKNYEIIEVKGVKVGLAAYTYESGKKEGLKTINGLVVPESKGNLINSFDPYDSTEDLPKIKATVDAMKKDSAEFIIFVMHWGVEYKSLPNENQLLIAQHLNNCGVDVIFGSHPHVVQPIDFIENDSTGQLTYVAYSMGNFISNQRYETMSNYNTEDGLMTGIVVKKEPNTPPVLEAVFYEPTWVHRYKADGRYNYAVLPANKTLKNPESFKVKDDATLDRVVKSSERTNTLIQKPMNESSISLFERYLIDFETVGSLRD